MRGGRKEGDKAEKYYALHLDDPVAPGFCSFDKLYIGTEKTIKAVADNLEKNGHTLIFGVLPTHCLIFMFGKNN